MSQEQERIDRLVNLKDEQLKLDEIKKMSSEIQNR